MNWHACLAAHHLNHFRPLLSLRLFGHSTLHRHRRLHILDLDRRHFHAPKLSWEWLRCFSRARLLVLVRYVMEPQAAHQDHSEKEREEEREHREDER